MMAPRGLQSLAAAVQAVAAAVSSVRSTSSVVANGSRRLKAAGTARGAAARRLDELEDALCVYVRAAPTSRASVNSDKGPFLFIVILRPKLEPVEFADHIEACGHPALGGERRWR